MIEKLESMVKDLNCELEVYRKEVENQKIDTSFEKQRLDNYLGEDLIKLFKNYNVIIAGGAITSLFTNNEINDIDVYFRNKEDVAGFLSEMFEYHIIVHTSKATLFSYDKLSSENPLEVQAIHYNFFNSPEDIFDSFDFTVCMGAYDFQTGEFVLSKDFLKHNSQRVLKYNVSPHPLVSLIRTKKYEEKGYMISKPEIIRLLMTCMNLNITSYKELKEEIGGMYGISVDDLFPSDDEEKFDLIKAIEKLENLHLEDTYFGDSDNSDPFTNIDDLVENALGLKQKYFVHNDEKYKIRWDGAVSDDFYDVKDNAVEVDIKEWFDPIVYKYVKQDEDGRLFSFHDSSFRYKIDEIIEAEDDIGLFLGKKGEIKDFYKNHTGSILLKCRVELEDFNGIHNGYPTFKKCVPIETVGDAYKNDKLDMGLSF